jgi:acetolactate synthase-1/2/3 large subunit
MKAAQSLLELAAREGVRACFANPGTSEMHLVAALDSAPDIRPVLCSVRRRGDGRLTVTAA